VVNGYDQITLSTAFDLNIENEITLLKQEKNDLLEANRILLDRNEQLLLINNYLLTAQLNQQIDRNWSTISASINLPTATLASSAPESSPNKRARTLSTSPTNSFFSDPCQITAFKKLSPKISENEQEQTSTEKTKPNISQMTL